MLLSEKVLCVKSHKIKIIRAAWLFTEETDPASKVPWSWPAVEYLRIVSTTGLHLG